MKILEKENAIQCPKCKSTLIYEKTDLQEEFFYPSYPANFYLTTFSYKHITHYIRCPMCYNKIEICNSSYI